MKLTPVEKLRKTRIELQYSHPAYAYLLMQLKFEKSEKLQEEGYGLQLLPDGTCLYNEEWVDEQDNMRAIASAIIQPVLHLGLQHYSRRGTRSKKEWDEAIDMVTDDILEKDGFPRNGPGQDDAKGLSAEEAYYLLVDERKDNDDPGNPPPGSQSNDGDSGEEGKSKASPDKHLDDEKSQPSVQQQQDWEDKMKQAAEFSQMQGSSAGQLGELVDDIFSQEIHWIAVLWSFITKQVVSDHDWSRPSRRLTAIQRRSSKKIYLPNVKKEDLNIAVVVDSSGSVSNEDLARFKSEICAIYEQFDNINMTVIHHTTSVDEVQVLNGYTSVNEFKNKERYYGGTSHIDVMKYLKKEMPNVSAIVCFTDGYTTTPEKITDYPSAPLLWVLTKEGRDDYINHGKITHYMKE